MYIPDALKMLDDEIYQFMHAFSFAVLVSEDLCATHLPFLVEQEQGVLYSHFARANPHWQQLDGKRVMVIFNGPHSYISPTWYQSTPAVPTWNYAAVHAYGTLALLTPEETTAVIDKTLEKFEPGLLHESSVVTLEHKQKLAKAIVGIKIEVTGLEGKQKLGQHSIDQSKTKLAFIHRFLILKHWETRCLRAICVILA